MDGSARRRRRLPAARLFGALVAIPFALTPGCVAGPSKEDPRTVLIVIVERVQTPAGDNDAELARLMAGELEAKGLAIRRAPPDSEIPYIKIVSATDWGGGAFCLHSRVTVFRAPGVDDFELDTRGRLSRSECARTHADGIFKQLVQRGY